MKIYKHMLSKEMLDKLVNKIKSGKYENIAESIIEKEVIKFLKNNPSLIERLDKRKYFIEVVKAVKSILYKGIGMFNERPSLQEHHSTKERDFSAYNTIFDITGCPEKIVDLGCGVNPLSYDKLGVNPEYVCYEINRNYVKIINEFFKNNEIKGKAICKDVTQMQRFPKADVYFMLKFLDSIELVANHRRSEELIKRIPANYVVVSFATRTISGKEMNVPERKWFELMCRRIGWEFVKFEKGDEIFYVVIK